MKRNTYLGVLLFAASAIVPAISLAMTDTPAAMPDVPAKARELAATAVAEYSDAQVELLAELVRYKTVHVDGMANADNPEFKAFKAHLRRKAEEFGLEFADHGAVAVISLGNAEKRLGIVTHGDVQPADASKWQKSPYVLDTESEPGRLIARGTEDDKAAIATALHAMKTIRESGIELDRRIELIVALTEESDWAPFEEFLAANPPPEMNIGIDASYPVVVAEKGWGMVKVTIQGEAEMNNGKPQVVEYGGGAFISQVPEDARIRIENASTALEDRIKARAAADDSGVTYDIQRKDNELVIEARGRAAHSSEPEAGLNALTHAAMLLDGENLANTPAGRAVDMVNELLGTDYYGGELGDAAYSHPFMGPLTVNLSTVKPDTPAQGSVEIAINTRAPAGKTAAQLEKEIRDAIGTWAESRDVAGDTGIKVEASLGEAYFPEQAPQVEPLLAVFRHYTGMHDARPISIGGGTNARLLPNAVNFGPSMPDRPYSGHSEHEFITSEQMRLNLQMYTAMLAWLAGEPESK